MFKYSKLFYYLILHSFVVGQVEINFTCELGNPAQDAPPFPKLPNVFEVKIEANFVTKNQTIEIEEYYDQPGNRWMVKQIMAERTFIYLYDNINKDQLFIIEGSECAAMIPEEFLASSIFGVNNQNGTYQIHSPSDALKFGNIYGEVYKGMTSIRGILVDHWQTCQYWPDIRSNMTVNYYFTHRDWQVSWNLSSQQIPVRAHVKGISHDGGLHEFEHIYDFLFFRPKIESPEVFLTPLGLLCNERTNILQVPQIPLFFQTSFQTIQKTDEGHSAYLSEMWYYSDVTAGLMRLDNEVDFPNPTLSTTDIYDFKFEILYKINFWTGTCDIQHIPFTDWNIASGGYPGMHIKDAQQIFRLDSNYTFTGKRIIRDLPCDVWIGQVDPVVLYEYCFFLDVELNPDEQIGYIPIQLTVYRKTRTEEGEIFVQQATFNYFKFRTRNIKISDFDVSICFHEDKKKHLKLTLRGQYHNAIDNSLEEFKTLLRFEITRKTQIFFTRIGDLQIYFEGDNFMLVRFTLLEYPHISEDRYVKGNRNLTNEEVYTILAEIVETRTWQIEFHPHHSLDLLYDVIGIEDDIFKDKDCIVGNSFQRFCKNPTLRFLTTTLHVDSRHDVNNCAQSCLEETSINCESFHYCYSTGQCALSNIHILDAVSEKDIVAYKGCDIFSRSYSSLYDIRKDTRLKVPFESVLNNIKSSEHCSKVCADNPKCKSFDFIKATDQDSANCTFFLKHTPLSEINFETFVGCDHYFRNYQNDFRLYVNTSIESSFHKSDEGVFNSDQCAWRCSMTIEINCRSFEVCNGHCYLQQMHKNDKNVKTVQSLICNHYSRLRYTNGSLIHVSAVNDYFVSGYSVGEMAGLAVAMLGLGIFIGIIGIFLFMNFWTKLCFSTNSDIMKLKILKKKTEESDT